MSWKKHQRQDVIVLGPCQGAIDVRDYEHFITQFNQPTALPRGSDMIHCGRVVHYSHSLRWHRGILWCQRCGHYAQRKVVKLADQCPLKLTTSYGAGVLKRISHDRSPTATGQWPLPVGAPCPYIMYHDGTEKPLSSFLAFPPGVDGSESDSD